MELIHFLRQYIKKISKWIIFVILITILLSLTILIPPYISKIIFNEGIMSNNMNLIYINGIILSLIYILIFILKVTQGFIFAKVKNIFTASIKKDIFNHILYLPIEFFEKNKVGYLLKKVSEIDSISFIFSASTANFITSIITFIGASFIICTIDVSVFLIAIVNLPLYYLVTNKTSKILKKQSLELLETKSYAQGLYYENINGIQLIKELNAEKVKLKEISGYIDNIVNKSIKLIKNVNIGTQTLNLITKLTSAIFIIIIGIYITKGKLTVGDYIALSQYIAMLYAPIQFFSNLNINIQPSIAAFNRLKPILDLKKEYEYYGNNKIDVIKNIKFEKVKFSYPGTNSYILMNINFDICSGDVVLLEGLNGSGKSTIIKLLSGLYNNYEGKILINDMELKEIDLKSLRNKESIVSQNIFLFSGSVFNNIVLSDENYSKEKVIRMMDILNLNIEVIEENGKNLSGGEKQKIALLRALIKKSDLIIFDEAISSIDKTAKKIFLDLLQKPEHRNKICLVISHEDFLKNIANKHLKLSNGEIMQIK
jgi:ABC-type bacteriocin/lantibiotic exporter with double-glycine peptidase domain